MVFLIKGGCVDWFQSGGDDSNRTLPMGVYDWTTNKFAKATDFETGSDRLNLNPVAVNHQIRIVPLTQQQQVHFTGPTFQVQVIGGGGHGIPFGNVFGKTGMVSPPHRICVSFFFFSTNQPTIDTFDRQTFRCTLLTLDIRWDRDHKPRLIVILMRQQPLPFRRQSSNRLRQL